jgi:hypothetical protein
MAQVKTQVAVFHIKGVGEVTRVADAITPTVAKVFYHTV